MDDFEPKTHTEHREVTVYALTMGRVKPKPPRTYDAGRSGFKPDPDAPKAGTNIGAKIGCKNTSLAKLAENLERIASASIDHRIVDAAGLQGSSDFRIGWTPRAMLQAAQTPNPTSGARCNISGD